MNPRIKTSLTDMCYSNPPIFRGLLRRAVHLALTVLALVTMAVTPARAVNILLNPGFEADGNHGSTVAVAGWVTDPGGPWYINSDSYAHSGNNYYKVWGQFNGSPNYTAIYQDNTSLPTSTYQADGWQFTLPTDIMWSGDDLDYSWLEVSFRDSGNNILALYRSDVFSDTLGSQPYTTGTWYDFPVTNVCQTVAPYSTIGTTNVLVAPPGTVKVRFQHTLYQSLYGGGSVYVDDTTLNQTGGPVPPQITQVYPGNLLFASNYISFHVTSASSSPISTANIHLFVNGTDVSGGPNYTVTGASPNITVKYTGIATNVWAYTASITVTDAYAFTASTSMAFDTVVPAYVWEAEDYDFTNGLYIENPTLASTPEPNSYFGVTGTPDVDYARPAGPSGYNTTYRPNDYPGIQFSGDSARQNFLTAQQSNPAVVDWEVGYINQYDWQNYTRSYPTGTFNIYGRLASGAGVTSVSFDDVTTPGVTNNLGVFDFDGTDWGAYQYVPLTDTNGNLLTVTLGGLATLRTTLESGGDNMNFFMVVPAVAGLPALSNISPTNGSTFVTGNTLGFTVVSPSALNHSGIHLFVNGADVSSHLVINGNSTSNNVTYSLLVPNTFYTAVIAVTNTAGGGTSRTLKFDTMSTGNFYVKFEDFDFNGGQYDTTYNGLQPNWYEGENDAILGVDYYHVSGGNYPYRIGLATEVTADAPLPGYSQGYDYDVGNFNAGDWGNYTRNYPPGAYWVYGRVAGYGLTATLSVVTSGQGTSTQTLQPLGTWTADPGGWQTWVWTPLLDPGLGAPVVVNLNGVTTLQVTSGGNINANYFMLVPVQGIKISVVKVGSNAVISFPTTVGATYRVFSSPSLNAPAWSLVSTVPGDGTQKSASDPLTTGQRFYKVTSP